VRGRRYASPVVSSTTDALPRPQTRYDQAKYLARVLRVTAGAEYKLKYSGSALGYIWSVAKPLALFAMLYAVFGHIFNLGQVGPYYPVSLLIGIVLFGFFSDATSLGMFSLVMRESLLRKLSFPRVVVPTAATLTVAITFGVNAVVVAAFLVWKGIVPQPNWLLIVPLLLELYLFILGVAFILSTLFVRLRDIGQVWELTLQLMFYASPIIYPIGYLPPALKKIAFLNPFTQVLQDIRAIVLYPDLAKNRITIATSFDSSYARLIPIAIALGVFVGGLAYFRSQEHSFAEQV
jgi:ABC-2 type transport system permease protein